MMKKINKKNKLIGAALVIAAIAFAGTASTAALTVGTNVGTLGYKAQTVLGGTVVAVRYTLGNGATPATIDHVLVEIKDPNLDVGALPVTPLATIILTDGVTPGTFLVCAPGVHTAGTPAAVTGTFVSTAASADSTFISDCTTVGATTNTGVINALTLTGIEITVQNN
jgi:hypothetical protein